MSTDYLEVLRARARKANRDPEQLRKLMRQVRLATGNSDVDRVEAKKLYLYMRELLKACQSELSLETARTQPSTPSG
jgi:hypothetical protein